MYAANSGLGLRSWFDSPTLSTDPLRNSVWQDKSWTVDDMLGRHNQTMLNPVLGETLENLISCVLQDLVFARDLGHLEHLVLLTEPLRTALRMGRCCTRSCQANLTTSPSRSQCSCNASSTARKDKVFFRPPVAMQRAIPFNTKLNGLPSQLMQKS